MAHPIVVHALCVFGVAHKAGQINTSINLKFVTDHANHGNVFARPIAFFQHFVAVDLAPLDLATINLARADRLHARRAHLLIFRRAFKRRIAAVIKIQLGRLMLNVKILCNPHSVFVKPLRNALISHAKLLQRGNGRSIRKHALVIFAGHVLGDETPLGICAAWILNHRIHIDAESVANAPDLNVLIEACIVAILSQQADISLAKRHLVLASGVIGNIGIGNVLNVPHHSVVYFCDFEVGFIIRRNNLASRTILPLVVGNLTNVLRQLVDGKTGPSVDRLSLHRATSRQHVSRPLPMIVW